MFIKSGPATTDQERRGSVSNWFSSLRRGAGRRKREESAVPTNYGSLGRRKDGPQSRGKTRSAWDLTTVSRLVITLTSCISSRRISASSSSEPRSVWSVSYIGSAALDSEPSESRAEARDPVTVGNTPASIPDSIDVLVDIRVAVAGGRTTAPQPLPTHTDIVAPFTLITPMRTFLNYVNLHANFEGNRERALLLAHTRILSYQKLSMHSSSAP
ncbi:hypothetical protein ACJJTC_011833 [Scirpophaga incertulas]